MSVVFGALVGVITVLGNAKVSSGMSSLADKQRKSGRVCARSAGLALTSSASVWLAFAYFADVEHIVWIWPLTAVQLGLLLPVWERRIFRLFGIAAGALGCCAALYLLRMPGWFSLALSGDTAAEVALAGWILSRGIQGFEDLKSRPNLRRFAIASVGVPCLSGVVASQAASKLLHHPPIRLYAITVLSDALGLAVLLPLMLFLLTGRYRQLRMFMPHLRSAGARAVVLLVVTGIVFGQTRYPFLFLVFPPLILLILAMGLEGAVFANICIVCISCFCTVRGRGPLWLVQGNSWELRVCLVQVFLGMIVATGLPVGALLDEHRRSAKEAEDARAIYSTLLENTSDMIILSSFDGEQRYITAACKALTGYTSQEFASLNRLDTFHPDDLQVAESVMESMRSGREEHHFRYRILHKTGGWKWVEATAKAYYDRESREVRGYVGTIRDLSPLLKSEQERERLSVEQEQLRILASTDPLTQLPNRRALDHAIQKHLTGVRVETHGAMLLLDLDSFKSYNDRYGHGAGDRCLFTVGETIKRSLLRSADLAARWGGEEFCVFLPGAPAEIAERIADKILQAVRDLRLPHEGNPGGFVTVSIGIATRKDGLEDPSLWIQRADMALYASKRAGKNRWTSAPDDALGRDSLSVGQATA